METLFLARFLTVVAIWLLIAFLMASRLRKFPRFSYEDLQTRPTDRTVPRYRWWYGAPPPEAWFALVAAVSAVTGILFLSWNPHAFASFVRGVNGTLVWLRDGDPSQPFTVPMGTLWVFFFSTGGLHLISSIGGLLATELIDRCAPDFLYHRTRFALGKWRSHFDKEKLNERLIEKSTWSRRCITLLLLAVCALGALCDDDVSLYVAAGGAVVGCTVILISDREVRRIRNASRRVEIERRFNPERLLSEHKKAIWMHSLRAWITIPALSLALAACFEFVTFDSGGTTGIRGGETCRFHGTI